VLREEDLILGAGFKKSSVCEDIFIPESDIILPDSKILEMIWRNPIDLASELLSQFSGKIATLIYIFF